MSATIEQPTPFQEQMRQRRVVKAVVADLVASSRRMETPAGLVTLVDITFLRELADVTAVTGEALFAVVDETHLARVAQAVGLIDQVPPPAMVRGSPIVVRPEELKAAIRWKGWTYRTAAMEFGVGEQTLKNWIYGYGSPGPDRRPRLAELIREMRAALAAEKGHDTA